jgi:hypothetical protein
MIRTTLTSTLTALALALGLCLNPLGAQEAVASTPQVKIQAVQASFQTPIRGYTFSYTTPVLSGVKPAVRAAVDKAATAFFATAISSQKASDAACIANGIEPDTDPAYSQVSGTTSGGIYAKRYLSVHLEWAALGCDDPYGIIGDKWLNLDLRSGKPVSLTKFVNTANNAFDYAVGIAIAEKGADENGPCWYGGGCHFSWPNGPADSRWPDLSAWKHPQGWTISSAGVTVYFSWEGSIYPYLITWSSITKAGKKMKKTVTTKVPTIQAPGQVTVAQTGTLVTIPAAAGYKLVGIRPAGSKTAKLFYVSTNDGEVSYTPGYSVVFASKTSRKATQANITD